MRLPAAALLLACVSTFAAEAKRLNVLLLVSDDCRASMGCYGVRR